MTSTVSQILNQIPSHGFNAYLFSPVRKPSCSYHAQSLFASDSLKVREAPPVVPSLYKADKFGVQLSKSRLATSSGFSTQRPNPLPSVSTEY